MGKSLMGKRPVTWVKVLQTTALALTVAFAVQGRAADDRAVKSRVAPIYPELAKRMKITGTVKIEAKVDAAGKVTEVKTLAGNHVLSLAAEDAVRKWRFVSGESESAVDLDINFELGQ